MGKKNFPLWFYLLWAALDALLRFWWLFIIGIILLIINPINRADYLIGAGIGLGFFVLIIVLSKLILRKEGPKDVPGYILLAKKDVEVVFE